MLTLKGLPLCIDTLEVCQGSTVQIPSLAQNAVRSLRATYGQVLSFIQEKVTPPASSLIKLGWLGQLGLNLRAWSEKK